MREAFRHRAPQELRQRVYIGRGYNIEHIVALAILKPVPSSTGIHFNTVCSFPPQKRKQMFLTSQPKVPSLIF